jgi:peptide/nickel transport system substrate-binding protein
LYTFADLAGKLYPPLADVRVRQALNFATNKKLITRAVCGPGSSATSITNAGAVEPDDPKYVNYYPYNPARARALLAAAGYPNGFTFKTVLWPASPGAPDDHAPVAHQMQKDLAAVGVTMEIDAARTSEEADQMWSSRTYAGIFQYTGVLATALFYEYVLKAGGPTNQHGWHDPMVDRFYLQYLRASQTKGAEILRRFRARLVTQAYGVPICKLAQHNLASKRVGGVRRSEGSLTGSRIVEWYPTGK